MTNRSLGVCYYPEHWPEDRWPIDAAMMVDTGLTWVRIGEFAWSRLEPTPGDLRFEWLDRAIDVLGGAGLKVILGTPTATPPRWMIDRHPDMLAVDREGRPRKFGSRRHYCFSHEGYRAECARIVTLLAERYGSNPHVAAWQTDNEYGCHDTTVSYSDAARSAFQAWLAARYGQIDSLNAAWGNIFWSMEYRTYAEVDLPNLTVTEPNPSHVLDFLRFSSDQVVSFNRLQTEILRTHSDAPLIHNYMGRVLEFDHFAVGADLDIASWDSYPLGFLEDRIDVDESWRRRFMRQGDPDFQAFHHDLYRAVGRGRVWVMEQQPGPVNWAPYNPAPLPGMARFWAWEAFAHGAETVCYFRWRQAPFAQEQMHAGLLRPDAGPAPALGEAAQVAREIADMPQIGTAPKQAAIVFDYASVWAWIAQPQGADFSYFRLVFDHYRAFRRAGLNVDILPPDTSDFDGYALVAIPGLLAWSEPLRTAVSGAEGVVLIGPRSGSKTHALSIPAALPPDMDALGVLVERVETLRPNAGIALAAGGQVNSWLEHLATEADVLERTDEGAPVVVCRGNLRYIGGWLDKVALSRVVESAARAAGLDVLHLPDEVRTRVQGNIRFVFNHGTTPVPEGTLRGLTGEIPAADFAAIPL